MALVVDHVSKVFGPTVALDNVSLRIEEGQVHGLIGHNGSGKSTLIKILSQYHRATSGSVSIVSDGVVQDDFGDALRFVHQNLGLIDQMTVAENLSLQEVKRRQMVGRLHKNAEVKSAQDSLNRVRASFSPEILVGALRPSEKTAVALARALQVWSSGEGYLILDEPTAVMPHTEATALFEFVLGVKSEGKGVLYVSHHLEEIFTICDVVTVLRDGRSLGTYAVDSLSHERLVRMIVGRDIESSDSIESDSFDSTIAERGGIVASNLWSERIFGVSIDVKPGEIVGVSGVTGSGRETLLPLLFGEIEGATEIKVNGIVLKGRDPRISVMNGMMMVPADRRAEAVFPELSMRENLFPAGIGTHLLGPLKRRQEKESSQVWLERLSVRPNDPSALISTASGGNQQKVIMARVLDRQPTILLLDEPTQGVDVGARQEIHDIVRSAAATGCAVLVASGDDQELAQLCTRVLVMSRGKVCAERLRPQIIADELTALSLGGEPWRS